MAYAVDTDAEIKKLKAAKCEDELATAIVQLVARSSDELATKADLKMLETELKTEMNSLETGLRAEMKSLETELKAEMNSLETGLKADMKSLKDSMTIRSLMAVGALAVVLKALDYFLPF